MSKPLILFLVISLFFLRPSNSNGQSDIDMILDVIKVMERPTSVISTLCWSPIKMARLAAALTSDLEVHTSIRFIQPESMAQRHYPDSHILFLADVTCSQINDYFIKNSAATHFRSPFRWLIVGISSEQLGTQSKHEDYVPKSLLHMDILPDGEVIIAVQTGNTSFTLHQIYRRSSGSPWMVEQYGTWTKGKPFEVINDLVEPMALRRLNLNGTVIPICYVLTNNDTINHLTDYKDDHIDTITKVNFPLTNQLLDFLRAGREYRFAETWGYRINGSWNGMIGDMLAGHAEVGGSPMFFTSDRISIVDYIASPTPTLAKFVFRQPKLSYENNVFLLPFRNTVWYCTIALVQILLIVLLVVTFWEWKHPGMAIEGRDADAGVLRARLSDVALFTFGAACQQGSAVELKGSLGRVVMLVLFLAFMFLYTSYSAYIVALLQSSSSRIKTLEDLLNSRLKFGVDDTVYNHYYFSKATEPIRKAIYETKVAPPRVKPKFMNLEEGVKNMRKGLFAFHMETGVGYKFVGKFFHEDEKCGLREIQYLQVLDPWLAIKKNSPYKEMFKIGMRRIQEFGLQDRENSLLYAKKPHCSGRGNSFVSVTMVDCYPALLIYTYGVIGSLMFLGLEHLLERKRELLRRLCTKRNALNSSISLGLSE